MIYAIHESLLEASKRINSGTDTIVEPRPWGRLLEDVDVSKIDPALARSADEHR